MRYYLIACFALIADPFNSHGDKEPSVIMQPSAECCSSVLGNGMVQAANVPEQEREQNIAGFAPIADHHAHIMSINAASLGVPELLPAITIPDEIAQLLSQRERHVRAGEYDRAAELFTKDAMVLIMLDPAWVKGEEAVRFAVENNRPFRYIANGYALGDKVGYITGTGVFPENPDKHVTNFFIAVRKDTDGRWKIAAETLSPQAPPVAKEVPAEQLVAELDAAGIQRGVVLSVAFWFGRAEDEIPDAPAKMRAENQWLSGQVAKFPDRLVGFGSVHPLKDYAVQEVANIAADPHLVGLKLHLGNSDVDLRDQEHREALRNVFAAANEHRLPIVIHMMVFGMNYGREHAELFIEHVLPAAPDIPVQIAHLAGSGPGFDADDALGAYIDAIAGQKPQMKKVYFDVASNVVAGQSPETLTLIAERLRQLGLHRILFASDRSGNSNDSPLEAWNAFQKLPLTQTELRSIANNIAPYLQPSE